MYICIFFSKPKAKNKMKKHRHYSLIFKKIEPYFTQYIYTQLSLFKKIERYSFQFEIATIK